MADPWETARQEMPTRIGRYEILSVLGRGGMGIVYLAWDPSLNRKLAVKVLARYHSGPEVEKRLFREARAAAQLTHPNICPIYEVGEEGEVVYFTMAYIEGTTLSTRVQDSRELTPPAIATLVRKIALALAVAHEHNIVHRDLKPSNILMDKRGEPIVADFGLARVQDEDRSDQTRSGMVIGTPAYMAPEQASGNPRDVGPRTDIYGLGAILYELLTGRPPFKAATALETLHRVIHSEPEPPRRLDPNIPRDLEAICLKALARNPASRYASMTDFAEDLNRFLRREPVSAAPRKGFFGWLWEKATRWLSPRKTHTSEPPTPLPRSPSPAAVDAGTRARSLPDPASVPLVEGEQRANPTANTFAPLSPAVRSAKGTVDPSSNAESSSDEFHLTLERTVRPAPPTGELIGPPLAEVQPLEPPEAHKQTQLAPLWSVPTAEFAPPVADQGSAKKPPPPLSAPPLADEFSERPFGNYVLIRKLGQGENGVVYLARHATQGWLTALKILPGARFSRADCVQRLLREARIAAGLRHPNVCQVLDAGTVDSEFYLAMEYLEGKTLRTYLQEHPGGLSVPLACYYAAQVLDALHYLARLPVVHRDVKPGNIMICPGDRLRLMDLGLAKSPDPAQSRLTLTGMVLGTPAYMAPEQIQDASSATPRSDLYSAGATLFEMLTGTTPFRAASAVEMMTRVVCEAPTDPRTLRPELPDALAVLVLRLLDKDPQRRPSHEEVRQALDALGQEMLTLSIASQATAPDMVAPPVAPPGQRVVSILARIDDAKEQIDRADDDELLALLPKKDGKICLGNYHLVERVGQKSAVNTYRAQHRFTGKRALVRILPLALAQMAPERVRDLLAQTTRLMEVSQTCPYLCPVFDISDARLTQGTFDTLYYTIEEYLDGKSLAELIGSDRLTDPTQSGKYLLGILNALEALHSRGLVHGNLHPGKLFFDSGTGQLRLTDLSQARPAPPDAESGAVHSGVHSVIADVNWLGDHSPRHRQYLAPENLSGRLPPGPLTEQYAVGVIFVEMLTGQCLRTHPNDLHLFECVQGDLQERLERIKRREKADGGAPRLSPILKKMVSVKPDMRFPQLGAAIRALASTKKRPARSVFTAGVPDPQGPSRSQRGVETVAVSDRTQLQDNGERQVFISYAWGDATPQGEQHAQFVEDLCQQLRAWGYQVVRDKENMKLGDRISTFMKMLGRGDRIIVVLSGKYLQSVYCMTELYEIYLQSRADEEDFRRRIIPLSLPDAAIADIEDRANRAKFWEDEGAKYQRLLKDGHRLADRDYQQLGHIHRLAIEVPNILALIADTLHPVGFEGIENNDFAGVKTLLERSV